MTKVRPVFNLGTYWYKAPKIGSLVPKLNLGTHWYEASKTGYQRQNENRKCI